MGFIQDKKDLIDEIGIFKTINDIPEIKSVSSFASVNEKSKNILPYMMDLINVLSEDDKEKTVDNKNILNQIFSSNPKVNSFFNRGTGEQKIKEGNTKLKVTTIVSEILQEFLPQATRILKEGVISSLKESLACGSDFSTPTFVNFNFDVKNIDYKNIFKLNADSGDLSDILFGNPNRDFDRFLYDVIQSPGVTSTWNGPNGPLLNVTFNLPSQLNFNIDSNYSNVPYTDFLGDFMSTTELFSKEKIIALTVDYFFGNISSQISTTYDNLISQQQTNNLIDKFLSTDPCFGSDVFDDSFFSFSGEDLPKIENKAKELFKGESNFNLSNDIALNIDAQNFDFKILLDQLKNTNSRIAEEEKIKEIIKFVQDLASDVSVVNGESIRDKISYDFLFNMPKIMVQNTILTPKILSLYNLSNYVINNVSTLEESSYNFAVNNRIFFEGVTRQCLAILIEIIYNKVKDLVLDLVSKVAAKKIKEVVKKRISIVASYSLSVVGGEVEGLINKLPSPIPAGSI